VDYLRWRTELLKSREQSKPLLSFPLPLLPRAGAGTAEIAPRKDPARCKIEVEALPSSQELFSQGDFKVCLAEAEQIPHVLREIGRLREVSFRQAGEGTGTAIDLDLFDTHYEHLFVWNREQCEIVGAYRLAATDKVVPRFGPQGLYTSTL